MEHSFGSENDFSVFLVLGGGRQRTQQLFSFRFLTVRKHPKKSSGHRRGQEWSQPD